MKLRLKASCRTMTSGGLLLVIFFFAVAWNRVINAQSLAEWSNTLFLEAEAFTNKGGWTVDQQYMDQMGSPVLLAHGFGQPVDDATTSVHFPSAGRYRVYVRTRNWVSPWTTDYAPGQFQLIVAGKRLETVFGTQSAHWDWQEGEAIEIADISSPIEIRLNDLTGFDGRVDAICLTRDPFIPPNDHELLDAIRKESLRLPEEIPDASAEPFDLVVVGGGVAGTCAAISAARSGLSVALVQDRPVLGGNNSREIRVHLCGDINQAPYPNLGNLTGLMGPHAGGNGREATHYKEENKRSLVEDEENITLFLNTHVIGVDLVDAESPSRLIEAVYGQNIETGQRLCFRGKLFADCTGDGNLGFLAGADWRMGREGRDETGESLAPEKGDPMTMGASIQWNTVIDEENNAFPILPWAIEFNEESIRPMVHGDWNWEAGMNLDQIADIEQIRDLGLRAAYGHWSYMKNRMTGEWAEKVKNLKLGWVSCFAGKRESRRLLGDVILCEQDLIARRQWEDASVTTTWSIDLHYPEDDNVRFFPNESFRSIAKFVHLDPYAIPYRCFYSRNVGNLFMAGRNISVTHVALGTVRVMRTGGMVGEVVGMAAAVCKNNECLPRDVYTDYLDQLQRRMEAGVPPIYAGIEEVSR